MRLSICIVHYFSETALQQYLKSIFSRCKLLPSPSRDFEVIVVDHGSRNMDQVRAEFPSVIILTPSRNLGFGAGLNIAAKASKGDYLFLSNPDLLAINGSFETLIQFLEANPKRGIVGPRLQYPDGRIQESCRRLPTVLDLFAHRMSWLPFGKQRNRYLMKEQDFSKLFQADWLVGAALMLRRDLFLQLGGFDERFFLFFEDTDLCRRVKEAGYEVWYCPDAVFTHTSIRLSESKWPGGWVFKKAFWTHVMSGIKYFWKWRMKS